MNQKAPRASIALSARQRKQRRVDRTTACRLRHSKPSRGCRRRCCETRADSWDSAPSQLSPARLRPYVHRRRPASPSVWSNLSGAAAGSHWSRRCNGERTPLFYLSPIPYRRLRDHSLRSGVGAAALRLTYEHKPKAAAHPSRFFRRRLNLGPVWWFCSSLRQQLLTAVNVVRRARQCFVAHDVYGQSGDVLRADDPSDGERGAEFFTPCINLIAQE